MNNSKGKRKILFRADGNSQIGFGHFIRTLSLAEMLNESFYCVFAILQPSPNQIKQIKEVCDAIIILNDSEKHYDEFLSKIDGDEIVILDNYYFTSDYQLELKSKGCKLVCIDDIHDKHYHADLVINNALGIKESDYSTHPDTRLLLGYKYALLRGEYLTEDDQNLSKRFECIIMMGGADPFNMSKKIVDFLKINGVNENVAIVVGEGYEDLDSLEGIDNLFVYKNISGKQVFKLFRDTKFGIFPASTVAIEACAARLPFICGYFIDNQLKAYNGIKQAGIAYGIGEYGHLDQERFNDALRKMQNNVFRKELIQKQKDCLDKQSKERFLNIFKEL